MNPDEIISQLEAAYGAHDIEWVERFWDPGIVAYFDGEKAFQGRDALLEMQREQFASRLTNKMQMTLRAASGNVIAFEWEATFTDIASGNVRYTYGAAFLMMRENRVIEWHNYATTYSNKISNGE